MIKSPYAGLEKDQKKVLIFTVAAEDWECIYRAHPYRGLQDALLATLFHQFVEKFKQLNITHYEPENIRKLESVLRGATIPPTVGDGHVKND